MNQTITRKKMLYIFSFIRLTVNKPDEKKRSECQVLHYHDNYVKKSAFFILQAQLYLLNSILCHHSTIVCETYVFFNEEKK